MKRVLLFVLILGMLAVSAAAQETYSLPATASQVTQLSEIVNAVNLETCFRWQKLAGCTDTGTEGTCVAAAAAGGSSCTAAAARSAAARIFPLTQAGRDEYVRFNIAAPGFIAQKEIPNRASKAAYCNWFNVQTQAAKDAECTKVGLLAGCPCLAQ